MFVPVILTLCDAEPYNGLVDLAKGLVVPWVRHGGDEGGSVHDLQRFVEDVQMGFIWKISWAAHSSLLLG